MAIVLELLSRSGQVLKYQIFNQQQVSVGRAYSNDFVIADDYVDPFHMSIHCVEGAEQFKCLDLGSVNGIVQHKKTQLAVSVNAGEKVILGKTILRVSSSDQVLSPALPLSFWETAADVLSRWWCMLMLASLFVMMHVFDVLINNPLVKHKAMLYSQVLYTFVGVAVCAGFYAFLARILRHDTRFLLYFNIALCALLVNSVYDAVEPILAVNLSSIVLSEIATVLFISLLLWVFLYVSLRYASHLTVVPRIVIASILPLIVAVVSFPEMFDQEDRFQPLPPYDPVVVNAAWYWRDGATVEGFVNTAESLYVQTSTQ